MTALEKAARAACEADSASEGTAQFDVIWTEFGASYLAGARATIESLRTPGIEHTDRIFNVMLDRILKEEV